METKGDPDDFMLNYNVLAKNSPIYKVDLPGYWHLIYGITAIHGEKKTILMELFDHTSYNKRFGY